uniref:Uncharacterized protein n=1 Tax=Peronospora matthiolae TaxID=2874970 RepID=A0AAV1TQI3_9STRA
MGAGNAKYGWELGGEIDYVDEGQSSCCSDNGYTRMYTLFLEIDGVLPSICSFHVGRRDFVLSAVVAFIYDHEYGTCLTKRSFLPDGIRSLTSRRPGSQDMGLLMA